MSKPPPSLVAAPFGPPRPDAIATIVTSELSLPAAQTLLYSVKRNLSDPAYAPDYEPELVILSTTPSVSSRARAALCPAICHRVVDVDPVPPPAAASSSSEMEVDGDDSGVDPGWTRLRAFGLEPYGAVLLLDPDCLVLTDARELLRVGSGSKVAGQGGLGTLMAAAAVTPSRLDPSALLVRPSAAAFDDILRRAKEQGLVDIGEFLGTSASDHGGDMASLPLLASSRWRKISDVAAHSAKVLHYRPSRPWESTATERAEKVMGSTATANADELWREWHRRSRNYATKDRRKREEDRKRDENFAARKKKKDAEEAAKAQGPGGNQRDMKRHMTVSQRYKELRKEGMSSADAMRTAQAEYGVDKDENNPGKQVSAMFGMG